MSLLDHFQGGGLPKKKHSWTLELLGFFHTCKIGTFKAMTKDWIVKALRVGLAKQLNAIKKQQKHMAKVHQNSMHYQTWKCISQNCHKYIYSKCFKCISFLICHNAIIWIETWWIESSFLVYLDQLPFVCIGNNTPEFFNVVVLGRRIAEWWANDNFGVSTKMVATKFFDKKTNEASWEFWKFRKHSIHEIWIRPGSKKLYEIVTYLGFTWIHMGSKRKAPKKHTRNCKCEMSWIKFTKSFLAFTDSTKALEVFTASWQKLQHMNWNWKPCSCWSVPNNLRSVLAMQLWNDIEHHPSLHIALKCQRCHLWWAGLTSERKGFN